MEFSKIAGNCVSLLLLLAAFNCFASPLLAAGCTYAETIEPPRGEPVLAFGHQIALNGDLLVAGGYVGWGDELRGQAFVFERSPAGWVHVQTIREPRGPGSNDNRFTTQIEMNNSHLVISDRAYRSSSDAPSGKIYFYTRRSDKWELSQSVEARDLPQELRWGNLGWSLSLHSNRLATGSKVGQVVGIFAHGPTGWWLEERLGASGGDYGDYFGRTVSLQGDLLLVTADHDPFAPRSAPAWFFERTESGWMEHSQLETEGLPGAVNPSASSFSGDWAVLSNLFSYSMADLWHKEFGEWVHAARLPTNEAGEGGSAHSLAFERGRLIVPDWSDSEAGEVAGAVFEYTYQSGEWVERKIYSPTPGAWNQLGFEVTLDQGRLAVSEFPEYFPGLSAPRLGRILLYDCPELPQPRDCRGDPYTHPGEYGCDPSERIEDESPDSAL